jgi:hypothetical protein
LFDQQQQLRNIYRSVVQHPITPRGNKNAVRRYGGEEDEEKSGNNEAYKSGEEERHSRSFHVIPDVIMSKLDGKSQPNTLFCWRRQKSK